MVQSGRNDSSIFADSYSCWDKFSSLFYIYYVLTQQVHKRCYTSLLTHCVYLIGEEEMTLQPCSVSWIRNPGRTHLSPGETHYYTYVDLSNVK